MSNAIDISVIIPMFNAAAFIENTINSVTAQQEHGWTYEIIVVDDKSTDNSVQIVKNLNNEKIRLIELQQNGGSAIARNTGIKMAKGEWVHFLDSDDTICIDLYRKFQLAQKPELNCYIFSFIREEFEFTLKQTITEVKDIRAFAHFGGTACNKFIKRDICMDFYDVHFSEDICFCVDMMNRSDLRIALLPDAYYIYYRKNVQSKTVSVNKKEFQKMYAYIWKQIPKSNTYTKMFIIEIFIAFLFQKSIPLSASLPKAILLSLRLLRHLPRVIMNQNRHFIINDPILN